MANFKIFKVLDKKNKPWNNPQTKGFMVVNQFSDK